MSKNVLRLLVALGILGSLLRAGDAAASVDCSGPYYNSRAWNSGWSPNEGGCWLSGSICYECWSTTTWESAGCEMSTADCHAKIEHGPFHDVASFWVRDESGVVTKTCVVLLDSDPLDETAFS
jgi:hypothetical protein